MTRSTRALGALVVTALVTAGLVAGAAAPSQARHGVQRLDACDVTGALTGSGLVGSPLVADLPEWDLGILSSSVSWLRNGSAFRSGGSSYTPVESDAGSGIQVQQTVTLLGAIGCTWTSNVVPISPVLEPGELDDPGDPGDDLLALLGGLALPGSAEVGQLVTLSDPVWSLPGVTTTYQWLRDGAPIPGADGQSYVPTIDDAGHAIRAQVTGALLGVPGVTILTDALDIPMLAGPQLAPVSDASVQGSRKIGTSVTVSGPEWDQDGVTSSYQWLRDGAPIGGATAAAYKLVAADFGHSISVHVTGHKDGFTDNTITSDPVEPLIGDAIQFTMKPRITGTARAGRLLTADPGQWTGGTEGSGQPAYSYQWLRDGAVITGAVAQTYEVDHADAGRAISVLVTATRPAYKSGKFTTAPLTVAKLASRVSATLPKKAVKQGQAAVMKLVLRVTGLAAPTGAVKVMDGTKVLKKAAFTRGGKGKLTIKLGKLKPGVHKLKAVYAGSDLTTGASSKVVKLTVRKK